MALICPWCGGELLGKPRQYAKCRHCSSDIFWGDGKPFKSNLEARHAEAQKTARRRTPVPKGVQSRRPTEPSQDVIDARFRHQLLKQKNTLDEGGQRLNILDRLLLLIVRILNRNKPKQVVVDRFLSTRRTFIKTAHSIQRIPRILSLTVVFLIAAFFVFIAGFLTPRVIEPHVTPVVNKITQLTTEVAQQLASLEVPDLDLSEVTSISDGAAKELAQWKGDSIKLVGLKSLDTQSAQELAKWKGSTLDLSGLKEITQTAASAFKSWSGSLLRLNGLESVNDDVAETLASFQATSVELLGLISVGKDTFAILKVNPKLSLPEIKFEPVELPVMAETVDDSFKALVSKGSDGFETLTSLTIVQAKYLIENFQGKLLNLSGLTSIDKDVAQELVKVKDKGLSLNGLTTIEKDVAQELAKFGGTSLWLNGLTSIDNEVAQEFVTFKGTLFLGGLTYIDKDLAQELTKFEGSPSFSRRTINFDGPKTWEILKPKPNIKFILPEEMSPTYSKPTEEESFKALLSNFSLGPSELTSLTNAQAKYLIENYDGDELHFPSLDSIDKDVAQELAKFEGKYLSLPGLTSIDKEVAQELAKFEGELYFGVKSINKDVAKELAKSKGLSLGGLTSIDKDVAKELAKHQGDLILGGLTLINKDLAQELGKFEGQSLWLGSLTLLDKDVAQELAKFKGGSLDLSGLTSLNYRVARELGRFKGGRLSIPYLKDMSDLTWQALTKNKNINLNIVRNF